MGRLYSDNDKELTKERFMEPEKEYRGAPFWAWNCHPDEALLYKELDVLKEMGMGGAHIHSRVGLDMPYLGEEFMGKVKACSDYMKKNDMLCCLYDEDRWPSGSAGGMVTKNHAYRQRYIVFKPEDLSEKTKEGFVSAAAAVRSAEYSMLARFEVKLDSEGYMTEYRKLSAEKTEDENVDPASVWEVRLEVSGDTPWFNNEAYVDTLNPAAMRDFINKTHEKYYETVGSEFGENIRTIFTDEPQMSLKEVLETPFERKAVILPFTGDFDDTFQKEYGFSIIDCLPELVFENRSGVSKARYLYHRHLVERFSYAFGDQVGHWCEKHGISLTGHMMNEWTLYSQTCAVGEAMRPMKDFAIPGIDMLCDRREFSTAKQASSIAHQMGREGAMSEEYGVTGWPFDFRAHKLAGDWQAALGITLRVHHLSWVSMAGEGKRDYPAAIGYQSPWCREYRYIEDHFARLNTALTRGTSHVDVAVIHPIESYWMFFGNRQQTTPERERIEKAFENTINWLLFGLVDFDFVSESVLAEEAESQQGDSFIMGCMKYKAVVLPACVTIRKNTYERLLAFREAGGQIVFMGGIPSYIDCESTDLVKKLAEKCVVIDSSESELLKSLEKFREIDTAVSCADPVASQVAQHEVGSRTRNMFYQLRDDKDCRWLFMCHVKPPVNKDVAFTDKLEVRIKGEYRASLYNTLDGSIEPIRAEYRNGDTFVTAYVSDYDSLLYKLVPGRSSCDEQLVEKVPSYDGNRMDGVFGDPVSFELSEPNVMLLDMAEYAFDDGEWNKAEEILRIDNLFREKLGFPLRMEALAQPWTVTGRKEPEHILHLRFRISSCYADIMKSAELAMEGSDKCSFKWNGQKVKFSDNGFFTDESIRKSVIGDIVPGENTLEVNIPFGEMTNVEWCYLLGKFGVRTAGKHSFITAYPDRLYFGDITTQGFPFYAGNIEYMTQLDTGEGNLIVETQQYRGALVKIRLDDKPEIRSVLAPYRVNLGHVSAGRHVVSFTVFGNRANAFGPVHNADRSEEWYGPNIWRTAGEKWCYEYRLEPMGIITAPMFRVDN